MKRIIVLLLVAVLSLLPVASTLEANVAGGIFADTRGHWAENEIDKIYHQGLMQGTGTDRSGYKYFSPEDTVNRFQLAVVMQRTFKLDYANLRFIQEPEVSDFYYDVEEQQWYTQAIILGAVNHIFVPDDEFRGNEELSRIELATTIYRAFQARGISVPMIMLMPQYDDVGDLTKEETNAMVLVSNTGIMKGNDNLFRPYDPIKRGELARVLNRCIELIEENPVDIVSPPDIKLESKKMVNESDLIVINLQIPVVSGLQNAEVQDRINNILETEALERQEAMIAEAQSMEEFIRTEPYHTFALESGFYKYWANNEALSFYVDYYSYTGGAHGMTERRTYNFNLHTGAEISLADLYPRDYDYISMINQKIQEEMDRNPGLYFTGLYGFVGISPVQRFYLEDNYLIIVFLQYEVAPYAVGIREFAIPYRFGSMDQQDK